MKIEIEIGQRSIDALVEALRNRPGAASPDGDMITTEEAARLLKVSPATVRRNKSLYPHVKEGSGSSQGRLLFSKKEILKRLAR